MRAKVAELADAPDLGSGAARRGGSSPPFRTNSLLSGGEFVYEIDIDSTGSPAATGTSLPCQHSACIWVRLSQRGQSGEHNDQRGKHLNAEQHCQAREDSSN